MTTDQITPGVRPPVPVAIIGAGPVGVTAAVLLARRGVRSVVLERHPDVYPLPRAVAMDDEVRRILQAAGIHEEFDRVARPAEGLRLLDARHRVMAEFRRNPHGHHGFPQTSMFEQPQLERLLRDALAGHPECELRGGVEVIAVDQAVDGCGAVRITFRPNGSDKPEYLWADAVLGCDGANSITREAIGATWEDLRFEERWVVLDVRTSAQVRTWEGVEQVCDPARAASYMRVGDDRYRWEFRVHDGEDFEGPAGCERILELARPWIGTTHRSELEVIRHTQYTFRARTADRWRQGRVFLLGDAAHQTPPFIGQGLGAGMRDAYNLSWKLARVLRHGASDRLLDTYQGERKPHVREVIRLAVAMGSAMSGGQQVTATACRAGLVAASRIPGLTSSPSRGLSPALASGPLVRRSFLAGRRLEGTICPQPWVTANGRRMRLDDALGDSFALLTAIPPTPSLQAAAEALGARIIRLEQGVGAPAGETVVTDDGTLAAWLRNGRAGAVLLRPDRVVLDSVPARLRGDGRWDTATWAPMVSAGHPPAAPVPGRPSSPVIQSVS